MLGDLADHFIVEDIGVVDRGEQQCGICDQRGGLALVAGFLTAMSGLYILALPAFAQQKLSVGYIATADSLPIVVAKEKGFFDRQKLDVTLVRIALASNVPSSVMSGSCSLRRRM